jgi:hypothetical protein
MKVDPNNTISNSRYSNVSIAGIASDHSNTPIVHDSIGLTTRGYDLHSECGIVIFLDVLGMKGIWKRFLRPIEVIKNWKMVIRSFMDILEQYPPNSAYDFRVLSDTIIITIPTTLNYPIIKWTFDFLFRPFIQSIKMRMLLRGAISYGSYYLSNRLIIGEALDDAACIHDNLKWIGISLSPSIYKKITNLNNINSERGL